MGHSRGVAGGQGEPGGVPIGRKDRRACTLGLATKSSFGGDGGSGENLADPGCSNSPRPAPSTERPLAGDPVGAGGLEPPTSSL